MYFCRNCEEIFEELKEVKLSYEEFYGCSHLFSGSTPMTMHVCPYCQENDIEDCVVCPVCKEYQPKSFMEDTEGMYNGGIGDICLNCYNDLRKEVL